MAPALMAVALAIGVASCAKGCSDDASHAKSDALAAQRFDVYALDEDTNAFAGRERDVPFPALADGTSLRTPREHEESLARFVATVEPPVARRILVGSHDAGDSFVRTFLVVVPAVTFDDDGRASLAKLAHAGKRVAFAIGGRVHSARVATPDDVAMLLARGKDARDR